MSENVRLALELFGFASCGIVLGSSVLDQARGIATQRGRWKGLVAKVLGFSLLGALVYFARAPLALAAMVLSCGFAFALGFGLLARPSTLR